MNIRHDPPNSKSAITHQPLAILAGFALFIVFYHFASIPEPFP